MYKKNSGQENCTPQLVSNDQKIHLGQMGGTTITQTFFHRPMYMGLIEVLDIIRASLEQELQGEIEYFRTLESGAFEEYVVVEKIGANKRLLFRTWPVLFAHNKRLEYRIYEKGQSLSSLITYYLGLCAITNNAALVLKE